MTRFTTLWAPRVSHANKIPGVCWMRIVMLWETKTSTGHFGVLRRLLRLITTYCLALLCLYLFSPFFSSSAALLHTHVYYYSFIRSFCLLLPLSIHLACRSDGVSNFLPGLSVPHWKKPYCYSSLLREPIKCIQSRPSLNRIPSLRDLLWR